MKSVYFQARKNPVSLRNMGETETGCVVPQVRLELTLDGF